jgi:Xaa-Pro aminopeptidase
LLGVLRPGITPEQAMGEAAQKMAPVVAGWPFSKPIYRAAAERMLTFQGHCSHTVGMAVHDVARYFGKPMEPGLVFALDPQMWVPEEKLYIRVEDTVAITNDGVEILTEGVLLELDEVEALMQDEGILQAFPPTLEEV